MTSENGAGEVDWWATWAEKGSAAVTGSETAEAEEDWFGGPKASSEPLVQEIPEHTHVNLSEIRSLLSGRTYIKVTSSRNVFLTGFGSDGTVWECTIDEPGDRWNGRWSIEADPAGEVGLVTIGDYQVALLGSSKSSCLRGPELTDGRATSYVWLTPLGPGQAAAPGSWAQGEEWESILRRALAAPIT